MVFSKIQNNINALLATQADLQAQRTCSRGVRLEDSAGQPTEQCRELASERGVATPTR